MGALENRQSGQDEPLYNIGAVARMTGISMATLRAWERRYDFPDAWRTVGGHRLYSEKDIFRLRWVKGCIDEGVQTAQAIYALRHQEQTGKPVLTRGSLDGYPSRFHEENHFDYKPGVPERRSYFLSATSRLIDQLTSHNIPAAGEVLADALAIHTPEVLILNLIRPALNEIGQLWEQGKIDVATEHLATNYLRERLLIWMTSGPQPRSQEGIVLACAPEEWHDGSLLILGALLRRRLWPVMYLGQSVPLPDLSKFVLETNPSMVVFVAMSESSATNLIEWRKWLSIPTQKKSLIVGYGGLVFVEKPEWRMKVPGIYLGDTFEEGISTIEKLLIHG